MLHSRDIRSARGRQAGIAAPVVVILVSLFALLLLGGWWWVEHHPTPGPKPGPNPRSGRSNAVLRLHGSNTIGAKLAPALVTAYLKAGGATEIQTRTTGKEESEIRAMLPGESKPVVIELHAHGSKTAFEDLLAARCDIGMASRRAETKEIQAAAAVLGDLTSPGAEHVIGLDGLAVIVNRNNRVQSLTKTEIAGIFSGAITDWSQAGGSPGLIRIYARDEKSGTWDTFKALVLGARPLASQAVRIEDSAELSNKVSADENGIGFIGLPYILNAKALAVSEDENRKGKTATTPLFPNRMTVATEDYPLSRRLYFYTSERPGNAWVDRFVQFTQSKAGQDVVAEIGFVSQNAVPVQVEPNLNAAVPDRYTAITRGKNRINLNFRFHSGRSTLDNKALLDIERVINLLVDLQYTGANVTLIGFADSDGPEPKNVALSRERARVVAAQFEPRGVHPGLVDGFGSKMPVASNDTPEGKEKNRRVEIWVGR